MTASTQAVGSFFRQLDYGKLKETLSLTNTQFSATQKSEALEMLKYNLIVIIKNSHQLEGLLTLPSEQLSIKHKNFILEAISNKLPEYIKENPNLIEMIDSIQCERGDGVIGLINEPFG